MGCHTWFSIPYKTDKEEIKTLAQKCLDENKYYSKSTKQMYQYAIDNELVVPVLELACGECDCNRYSEEWILYKDVYDYSLEKHNKENNTNYQKYRSKELEDIKLESYSDEPRIGGYPENVIKSFEEMESFMKKGYTDDEGNHFDFYFHQNRIESVMEGIKTFFKNHPKGIITFG